MLLIPIGQENSEVRRLPWVSYVLIGINVAVSIALLAFSASGDVERELHQRTQEVELYLDQHPYLLLPPEIAESLPPDVLEEFEKARAEAEQRVVLSESALARQQEELNERVRRLTEARQRLPWIRWGFVPARRAPATFLTSLFIHAGWLHLLGNMLFFFLTGPFVEDVFGRPLFTGLYLLSGAVANAVFALHFPDSTIPVVGASGAIAGIMGAFLFRLGGSRIQFLVLPIPIIPALRFTMFLPAFVVIPAWLVEQIWYASHTHQGTGVAWWAHIGGFFFGFLVAGMIKLMGLEESWVNPAIEKRIGITQHPSLELATDARTAGDLATAHREIAKVLAAEPGNVEACLEAYEIAVAGGHGEEIGRTATRLLDLYARSEPHLAAKLVEEVTAGGPPASARFYLAAAAFLEGDGDGRGALRVYERLIELWPNDAAVFRAWLRQAEILRKSGELRRSHGAYLKARAHPGCVERWVEVIERGLAETAAATPRIAMETTEDDEPIVETSSGAVLQRDEPARPEAAKPPDPKPPARTS